MVQIDTMTLADFEQIKDVYFSDFDVFWSSHTLEQELTCDNSHLVVAKIDNEIVGFAGFKILFDEADIMNIVVKKSLRGKGIGSLLLKNLIDLFYSFSLNALNLEVNEKNVVAIHLYEKFGFQRISVRKKYYPKNENAIIMCLKAKNN